MENIIQLAQQIKNIWGDGYFVCGEDLYTDKTVYVLHCPKIIQSHKFSSLPRLITFVTTRMATIRSMGEKRNKSRI